ncbi:MAG: neuraminidase, partial [Sphingobacteriales bacterium]
MSIVRQINICCLLSLFSLAALSQQVSEIKVFPVGEGWAGNSINTVIFRKNALCTFKNIQYIAYYNNKGFVVLGKRKYTADRWLLQTTSFKGNIYDAHNAISIAVDGEGYLHLAWDHHNNALHYTKSKAPGSLDMEAQTSMTGKLEKKVTYPEFHRLPGGDLVFLYRDGQSGQGNLVMNRYSVKEKSWKQLHQNLLDGQGRRNAYWQACVDKKGAIHISWVWRESPDVASNHDLCYAVSPDGGLTWKNSMGKSYALPINAATAEYICRIPQGSELINQTSMYANDEGTPFIASYWKDAQDTVPQYHIVYRDNG